MEQKLLQHYKTLSRQMYKNRRKYKLSRSEYEADHEYNNESNSIAYERE
jgi:hypothetical protein